MFRHVSVDARGAYVDLSASHTFTIGSGNTKPDRAGWYLVTPSSSDAVIIVAEFVDPAVWVSFIRLSRSFTAGVSNTYSGQPQHMFRRRLTEEDQCIVYALVVLIETREFNFDCHHQWLHTMHCGRIFDDDCNQTEPSKRTKLGNASSKTSRPSDPPFHP